MRNNQLQGTEKQKRQESVTKAASESIDFVITWVDGNNQEWQQLKSKYRPGAYEDGRKRRYRDWDNLQFLFRGIEKYASWVRNVYLVTPGFRPEWIRTDHPKLKLIDQNTLLPADCIPTFNNAAVELMFHKLPNLSERFVYFNDDMFLLNYTQPSDFFKAGLPCDNPGFCAIQATRENDGLGGYGYAVMSTRLIAQFFDKQEVIRENRKKIYNLLNRKDIIKTILVSPYHQFTGINETHLPYSYLKETYETVWGKVPEELNKTVHDRFRKEFSIVHWIMRYWQICSGKVAVRDRNDGHYFEIQQYEDCHKIVKEIERKRYKMICINDNLEADEEFGKTREEINAAFARILPDKSSFEQ